MPNKRNAVGSPSRAMGKKRSTTSRTGGKKVQPEEIAQKKDGAGQDLPRKQKRSDMWWQKYLRKLLISHQVMSRRRMHGHSPL
ncbi:Hypothetical predicted protein [Mytilus galloprovincialis]|uniref:Uncharacterized protein n=1 Tax=Mytilus galloprovincialis TaxID=29158 RepID=A0A8B6BYP5_MYTGA|nr:Hypothetical predicted protein [Mytilus galloprovincialis]